MATTPTYHLQGKISTAGAEYLQRFGLNPEGIRASGLTAAGYDQFLYVKTAHGVERVRHLGVSQTRQRNWPAGFDFDHLRSISPLEETVAYRATYTGGDTPGYQYLVDAGVDARFVTSDSMTAEGYKRVLEVDGQPVKHNEDGTRDSTPQPWPDGFDFEEFRRVAGLVPDKDTN